MLAPPRRSTLSLFYCISTAICMVLDCLASSFGGCGCVTPLAWSCLVQTVFTMIWLMDRQSRQYLHWFLTSCNPHVCGQGPSRRYIQGLGALRRASDNVDKGFVSHPSTFDCSSLLRNPTQFRRYTQGFGSLRRHSVGIYNGFMYSVVVGRVGLHHSTSIPDGIYEDLVH